MAPDCVAVIVAEAEDDDAATVEGKMVLEAPEARVEVAPETAAVVAGPFELETAEVAARNWLRAKNNSAGRRLTLMVMTGFEAR